MAHPQHQLQLNPLHLLPIHLVAHRLHQLLLNRLHLLPIHSVALRLHQLLLNPLHLRLIHSVAHLQHQLQPHRLIRSVARQRRLNQLHQPPTRLVARLPVSLLPIHLVAHLHQRNLLHRPIHSAAHQHLLNRLHLWPIRLAHLLLRLQLANQPPILSVVHQLATIHSAHRTRMPITHPQTAICLARSRPIQRFS